MFSSRKFALCNGVVKLLINVESMDLFLYMLLKFEIMSNYLVMKCCHFFLKTLYISNEIKFFETPYVYIYIYIKYISWPIVVLGDLKAPFSIATIPRYRGKCYSFPLIAPLTLDIYIMLSVKQEGIKYHCLSHWYDLAWDQISVSQTIGKHSNHLTKIIIVCVYIYIYMHTV